MSRANEVVRKDILATATDAGKGQERKDCSFPAEQDFPGQPEIAPQFWLRANLGGDSAPHALGTAPLALVGSLHAQHGFAMKAIMTINERKTNEKLS